MADAMHGAVEGQGTPSDRPCGLLKQNPALPEQRGVWKLAESR